MEFKVNVRITADDYGTFLVDSIFHSKKNLALFILGPIILLSMFLLRLYVNRSMTVAMCIFAGVAIACLVWTLIFCFSWKRRVKKFYDSDKTLQQEQKIVVDEDGVTGSLDCGTFKYKADQFVDVIYGKKVISLFVAPQKAILLPRHCFDSESQGQEVEKIIQSYGIGQKQRQKSSLKFAK